MVSSLYELVISGAILSESGRLRDWRELFLSEAEFVSSEVIFFDFQRRQERAEWTGRNFEVLILTGPYYFWARVRHQTKSGVGTCTEL